MQAHDSNEYDNEMEIYNLDDIEIVEEGGGSNTYEASRELPIP